MTSSPNTLRRAHLLRATVTILLLLSGFALVTNVCAQNTDATAPSSATIGTQQYGIPAGFLTDALLRFATESNITVQFDAALTKNVNTNGLQGVFSVTEGLTVLLNGSGLTALAKGGDVYALQAQNDSDVMVFDSVRVGGSELAESAYGPVEGYVANRSSASTKTDTLLIETPRSISVITADQIKAQNAGDIGAVFRYTSGIYSEQRGAVTTRASLVVRGFRSGDYVSRDGMFDGADSETNAEPVPYGLERVELLKGPASVLYGQGSPGGIVSTITKRPTENFFSEVGIDYGSFNQLGGKFDVGGPLDDNREFLFRLTGEKRDGDAQVDYVENNHVYIAPALTWRISSDTSLTLLGHYQEQESYSDQFLPASGLVLPNPNGKISTHLFQGEPSRSDLARTEREGYAFSYLFEHYWNDNTLIRHNARYTDSSWGRFTFGYTATGAGDNGFQADQRTLNRGYFVDTGDITTFATDTHTQFKFEPGKTEHTALIGFGYKENKGHGDWGPEREGLAVLDAFDPVYGTGEFPTSLPNPLWDEDWKQTQYGVYVQDQIKFPNKLVFTVGARHDWAEYKSTDNLESLKSKDNDKAFTGQTGLLYLFDNGLSPYVSYSESFKPEGGTDFYGNAFEPTTGTQYEAGIKYQPFGGNSLFTVAVFDLTQQNVTTTDPIHTDFEIQTGELSSQGIELEAKTELFDNFSLIANYSYTDIEVTKSNDENLGKRPARAPNQLASIWADYTMSSGLGVSAGVRYVGDQAGDTTNTFEVPSFTLVDAAIYYDVTQGDLKSIAFSLNMSNLLDKTFVANCESQRYCLFGARRNITASIAYNF